MRILVIEDDRKVANFIQAGLEQEGYERGHGEKKGVLSPGGSVKVKEGMEFHVKDTGES